MIVWLWLWHFHEKKIYPQCIAPAAELSHQLSFSICFFFQASFQRLNKSFRFLQSVPLHLSKVLCPCGGFIHFWTNKECAFFFLCAPKGGSVPAVPLANGRTVAETDQTQSGKKQVKTKENKWFPNQKSFKRRHLPAAAAGSEGGGTEEEERGRRRSHAVQGVPVCKMHSQWRPGVSPTLRWAEWLNPREDNFRRDLFLISFCSHVIEWS